MPTVRDVPLMHQMYGIVVTMMPTVRQVNGIESKLVIFYLV
jgi:hypothetical protein